MIYIVDAHAMIWFLANHPNVGTKAKQVLLEQESRIVVPATALAELMWVVERKPHRIAGLTHTTVWQAIDADPRITIYSLDRRVIERSLSLTAINELHDRQIVATTAVIIDDGGRLTHHL